MPCWALGNQHNMDTKQNDLILCKRPYLGTIKTYEKFPYLKSMICDPC